MRGTEGKEERREKEKGNVEEAGELEGLRKRDQD